MKLGLWQRLWVTGTVCLVSFLVYTPQIFIVWPWYGRRWSLEFLKVVAPLNFCGIMIFWNYYLCVMTDPGHVPSGWRPDPATKQAFEVKKLTHGPRYCKTCHEYKPPRTHHCRQCKQCILKMDHHCPWIANCVGFRNQGHFLRFLIWVDFGMLCHLTILFFRLKAFSSWTSPEPTTADVLWMVFNLAAGVPVWLCIGIFSLYHLYCAAGNSTTIEGWEKDRVATLVRRGKIKEIKYPYVSATLLDSSQIYKLNQTYVIRSQNLGFYRNLKAVLGPNPLFWLWPQPMAGDGLAFQVSETVSGILEQHMWPPRDPDMDRPIRPLPNPTDNPFTYGGNSFNPALQPSNSSLRSRSRTEHSEKGPAASPTHSPDNRERTDHGIYSSGEDRDDYRSSPEPYLSDMDDSDDEPLRGGEEYARGVRVRRGSEGYEVAAVGSWNWMNQLEEPQEAT